MTRVKMLTGMPMSPDGLNVEFWAAGSVQDVNDEQLAALINRGAVEIVEGKAYVAAPENKGRKGRKK